MAQCNLELDKPPCYLNWNINDTRTCNGGAICKLVEKRYLTLQTEVSASVLFYLILSSVLNFIF
jgi:hypothetical protein